VLLLGGFLVLAGTPYVVLGPPDRSPTIVPILVGIGLVLILLAKELRTSDLE
jgi:hypothetical protein